MCQMRGLFFVAINALSTRYDDQDMLDALAFRHLLGAPSMMAIDTALYSVTVRLEAIDPELAKQFQYSSTILESRMELPNQTDADLLGIPTDRIVQHRRHILERVHAIPDSTYPYPSQQSSACTTCSVSQRTLGERHWFPLKLVHPLIKEEDPGRAVI